MKIVVTSDTHFGDGTSQLAALDSSGNPIQWEHKPDTNQKMINYYKSSNAEIESLNKENNLNIPVNPKMIIFGHSHRPIGIKDSKQLVIQPFNDKSLNVTMFNTGGWLEEGSGGQFNGIELFTYETGKGISSAKI